ncbi:MAG: hypothetical protein JXB15_12100 [Anaerolineales bacterium]|nr:hypothetical protein [Anaerolineales bacterium]
MSDWREEIEHALDAFISVAELAGNPIARAEIQVEYLPAPHRPPTHLPAGKMAVYGFWGDGVWLKIGKVGPKSAARYCYQHYNGDAPSTLAGSLASDPKMRKVAGFKRNDPGEWMKASTSRVNILLSSQRERELLSLLEAFLHLRLRPRYEG